MTRLFPSISFTVAPMKEVSLITIVGDVDNDIADYIDKTINSEGIAVHVSCGKLIQRKVAEENLAKIFESGFYSPSESRDYHFLPLEHDFIKENILKRDQPMVTVSSSDAEPINVGDWITFGTDDGKSIVKTPLCLSKIVNRKNGYFILVLERISTGNK